jgi:hypothetical protein
MLRDTARVGKGALLGMGTRLHDLKEIGGGVAE